MGGRSDTMGPFVEASGYEGGVWEEEEGQSQINLRIKTSCSNSILDKGRVSVKVRLIVQLDNQKKHRKNFNIVHVRNTSEMKTLKNGNHFSTGWGLLSR